MDVVAVTVDGIAAYGGHDTIAFEGSSLEDVLSTFDLPVDTAALAIRAGVDEKLRAYELEWNIRIPKSLADFARYQQLSDAAAASGIIIFAPGVYGLEWKCVAPWGEADGRRVIAGAVQEGQGCFYAYFPVEHAAVAASKSAEGAVEGGSAGAAATGAASGGAGAGSPPVSAVAAAAPSGDAPPDCPVLIGDFEWSELQAMEAVPGTALRRAANSLYAFLRQAHAAVSAGAGADGE